MSEEENIVAELSSSLSGLNEQAEPQVAEDNGGVEGDNEVSGSDGLSAEGTEQETGTASEEDATAGEHESVQADLYTVRVDGEEQKVPLEELVRGYAHGTAANKRFQEAAELRKQSESEIAEYKEFLAALHNDPIGTLRQVPQFQGILKESIQAHLVEEIRRQQLTPEQREAEDFRSQRDEEQRAYEEFRAKRQEEEQAYRAAQFQKQLGGWVNSAGVDFTTDHERNLYRMNLRSTLTQLGTEITEKHVQDVAAHTKELLAGLRPQAPKEKPVAPPAPGGRSSTKGKKTGQKPKFQNLHEFFDNMRRSENIL